LAEIRNRIDGKALFYLNVPLPQYLFGFISTERFIYDYCDHYGDVKEAIERCFQVALEITKFAVDNGVKIFFSGFQGIFSPRMMEDIAIPYAIAYSKFLHQYEKLCITNYGIQIGYSATKLPSDLRKLNSTLKGVHCHNLGSQINWNFRAQ
jgi:hypothetical protein